MSQDGSSFCNWLTQAITDDEVIKIDSTAEVQVNLEGVIIKKQPEDGSKSASKQFLYPSNEQVVWDINLTKL